MVRCFAVLVPALLLAGCGEESPIGEGTPSPAPAASQPAGSVQAVTDPAEAKRIAHDRHERFEEIGKAFKGINDQLKTPVPDLPAIQERAALIDRYAPQIAGWFPAGTGPEEGIRTDALATIWSEPERFRQASASMVQASAAFNAAAQNGDVAAVRAAAKPLGQACKVCHDRFREEES